MPTAASALAADGIPVVALRAYQRAAAGTDAADPACGLSWTLLAGIGRVESDHGRFAGAVLLADGTSTIPIIGIPLDGVGTEVVTDTDDGRLDGDPVFDRAIGPMQFIPSTWAVYGADGDGDGIADPFDIDDAALAAAHYLCATGNDLATRAGQVAAVLTYNHSSAYVAEVLALAAAYAGRRDGRAGPGRRRRPGPLDRAGAAPVDRGHRGVHPARDRAASVRTDADPDADATGGHLRVGDAAADASAGAVSAPSTAPSTAPSSTPDPSPSDIPTSPCPSPSGSSGTGPSGTDTSPGPSGSAVSTGGDSPTPTPTPGPTWTDIPSPTDSATPTETASSTPTDSPTPTPPVC